MVSLRIPEPWKVTLPTRGENFKFEGTNRVTSLKSTKAFFNAPAKLHLADSKQLSSRPGVDLIENMSVS
jgi:hypothetical protein